MDYTFLVDTYASERLKTLSVWAMFDDADLDVRPHPNLARDRTFHEHMVHQCYSEDRWFTGMFGIDVGAPPLPAEETRLAFIKRYDQDSAKRLDQLHQKPATWWEHEVAFFDTIHSRAWIMVRRIAHTARPPVRSRRPCCDAWAVRSGASTAPPWTPAGCRRTARARSIRTPASLR